MDHRRTGLIGKSIYKVAQLLRCERGNTLIIASAFLLPLLGLIGSGVDLGRAYLTKNKLQQACDAGVLAGRKVYVSSVDANVKTEVRKFVDFNFPQGTNQTDPFNADPQPGSDGAITMSLATKVPTAIMRVFGFTSIPISASCTARQDFVNTDVMFVLDTTLSMNCLPSDGPLCYSLSEKSGSKIEGLRTAVTNFYNTLAPAQAQLEKANLRLRYGILPYSETVNTGALIYAKNPTWMQANPYYQQCSTQQNGGVTTCNGPVSFNKVPKSASWYTSGAWNGCIEERKTVNTIDASSGYTPPAGATDLDVDSPPSGATSTQWAPYDPASVTAKSGYPGIDSACPSRATQLKAYSSAQMMSDDIAKLKAGGYTYHDVGMLWAARLLSPTGMWASDNPTTYNNFPVNRHVIYMTDGRLEPDPQTYSAYGVEQYATGGHRVTRDGTKTSQYDSHMQRFRMMCSKLKSMNVSVWVVAFGASAGTGLSPDLQNCASSPSQAFAAADSASLDAYFQQISQTIGALRLSQ